MGKLELHGGSQVRRTQFHVLDDNRRLVFIEMHPSISKDISRTQLNGVHDKLAKSPSRHLGRAAP